ncbi:hypothetical protein ACFHW2_30235 [Actinomadura sp. LOL_016]|uniref:hypothetical protein n=1 Tax=unclassified Actinomadura TaxID=2626254 RepID=UPI003A811D04
MNSNFFISGSYAEGGQVWKTICIAGTFDLYDKKYWDKEGGWFWMKNGGRDVKDVNGPFARYEDQWHSFQYVLPWKCRGPPSRARYNNSFGSCNKETNYQGMISW